MKEDRKDYRSLPFWSWNDKLEVEQLKKQIHWMKENGMGGYFMHARSGLQTEYLSEEWMECIEACAQEGKTLGMKSWIYDENGWPSGFVGGKLLENEENHDKYILADTGVFDAHATVSYLLGGERLVRVQEGSEGQEYLNLYIHNAVSTVDILNPDVVKQFLQLTHEAYKERFGEHFSERIEGFFTDEPQYYRWDTPYTVMIEKYWKEQYGEDILEKLGLLFVKKEGYRQFRYRYWRAMQDLMLHGFSQTVYEWCEEHDVQLTGHYIEETTMGFQMMCCGGVMPFYEYMHIPGIDWLGKNTVSELSPKQVGSVAAQLGKKQVLTETYACCGWDVTPAELRRVAGFQYVNGVNRMCQHLVPYSERGSRKYDHPAHYSQMNPWVKEDFKTFNQYFEKLGYILGEGKQCVNVAVLHPIRSTYFDYDRSLLEEGFGVEDLDRQLLQTCRTLSSRGIGYHFLDETLLAKYGYVKHGKIGCGMCSYDFLVFPTTLTMDKTTERLVRQYVKEGGKVLLFGNKPQYLEADLHDYSYLNTNVTLEEILSAQPYQVKDYMTDIYSTYREWNGKQYLYVINASDCKTYTQIYECGEGVKALMKVNLTEETERIVPFVVKLKPGEDALFYFTDQEIPEEKELTPFRMKYEHAKVRVSENNLPVDRIRYSKDGVTYSKTWPCPALFQKLLKERYEGKLYLRYEFEVEDIPDSLYVRMERSREIGIWMNGHCLGEPIMVQENYVELYDVLPYVCKGVNNCTVAVDWYENPNVYYALFGENVTESLKNCIVYDTELQPIELTGQFGVYPREGYRANADSRFVNGDHFYIGTMPTSVSEPSVEGFPFLSGELVLMQKVCFETSDILLELDGNYSMAEVTVNGMYAGRLLFEKELDLSRVATVGENEITVRFLLDNRNRMGPHHLNGDKNAGIVPWSFELNGTWDEDQSEMYHEDYDIKKVFLGT